MTAQGGSSTLTPLCPQHSSEVGPAQFLGVGTLLRSLPGPYGARYMAGISK